MAPGRAAYHAAPPLSKDRKPTRSPKDIFITASAKPFSTAQAAFTFPACAKVWNSVQAAFRLSALPSRPSSRNRYTGWPASLNSGEITSPALTGAMAKEMRVGGTSRSRKDPDMESLPPMAAQP